jgi:thiol:disulfide interchange protein DsbA
MPTAARLLTTLLCLAATLPAAAAEYVAGKHYQVLDTQVRTAAPEKIEVAEVFWYGCGHCFTFEPQLEQWATGLGDDVVLTRSPAIWHPTMELHARAYYTAKALGVLDELHRALFDAMNLEKNRLASEGAIAKIFANHGVDADSFHQTFNSFGVNSAVRQADARQRSYQISGTPEMIVDGKYRITARMAGGHEGMLAVTDHLIALEREKRAAAGGDSAAPEQ